jgi:hypothetical protein
MHMWHHVTNHLIISNDKDSNSENRIKLRVRDTRYLNVIPAKDTKSITPDHEPLEVRCSLPILQLFATTPLTDGSVFNYEVMREVHEEACYASLSVVRLGR